MTAVDARSGPGAEADAALPVRVLLPVVAPEDAPDAIARAYHEISSVLAGTPGLIRNELLHDVHSPRRYTVLAEWASQADFDRWEQSPGHRPATAPLRPYQDPDARPQICRVVAAY